MAVLLPGKFIYLSTPHTATISTTSALSVLLQDTAWATILTQNKKLKMPHTFSSRTHHSTRAELLKRNPEAFIGGEVAVTTLRNPYDLSVTWWLRQKGALAEKLSIPEPSFEEYILNYCGEGGPYIRDGKIFWLDADEHFRYETLQKDLNLFLERFDLPKVELPSYNVTGKTQPGLGYHTAKTLGYIRETFGAEIEAHGYEVVRG